MSKKRIEITGTLQAPLTQGCAAFIQEAAGTRRTCNQPVLLSGGMTNAEV